MSTASPSTTPRERRQFRIEVVLLVLGVSLAAWLSKSLPEDQQVFVIVLVVVALPTAQSQVTGAPTRPLPWVAIVALVLTAAVAALLTFSAGVSGWITGPGWFAVAIVITLAGAALRTPKGER